MCTCAFRENEEVCLVARHHLVSSLQIVLRKLSLKFQSTRERLQHPSVLCARMLAYAAAATRVASGDLVVPAPMRLHLSRADLRSRGSGGGNSGAGGGDSSDDIGEGREVLRGLLRAPRARE